MKNRSSKSLAAGVAILFLATAAFAQMGQPKGQDIQAPILSQVRIDQKLDSPVPLDAQFRDERGQTVKLGDYFGKKPVLLALVYYQCPMLCTEVLNGMTSALKMVKFNPGQEFEVVVVSINPRETPQMAAEKKQVYLRAYKRPETEHGWHFLVGDEPDISRLADAVGFRYAWDERSQQYAHAAAIMVLTPAGKLAQYYYGIEYSPNDLRLGLVQASQGRIGTIVDAAILYCYHYDPTTGRYGLVIMRALRLAATATMVLVGGFILVMVRRERKKPALVRRENTEPTTTGGPR